VTGGGITPFEASSSGLPCAIISTEPWERINADELARRGGAIHGGYRDQFDPNVLLADYDIGQMSEKAAAAVDGAGTSRVVAAMGLC